MRNAPVAVFEISLDAAPIDELGHLLDNGERSRADRFVRSRDRTRFVAAHSAVRLILAAETGVPPASVRMESGPHGKPSLPDAPDIHFNLSHAGDRALVAVSRGFDVGVDLEAIRPDVDADVLAKQFFSRAEQAELFSLPAEQRVRGFFNAWTRKEAYLKGRGDGITFGLDHFDVTLTPGVSAAIRVDRNNPGAAARWSIVELAAPPGFAAALAVDGAPPDLTFGEFSWSAWR